MSKGIVIPPGTKVREIGTNTALWTYEGHWCNACGENEYTLVDDRGVQRSWTVGETDMEVLG